MHEPARSAAFTAIVLAAIVTVGCAGGATSPAETELRTAPIRVLVEQWESPEGGLQILCTLLNVGPRPVLVDENIQWHWRFRGGDPDVINYRSGGLPHTVFSYPRYLVLLPYPHDHAWYASDIGQDDLWVKMDIGAASDRDRYTGGTVEVEVGLDMLPELRQQPADRLDLTEIVRVRPPPPPPATRSARPRQ